MPRTNPPPRLTDEVDLARRIAYEREVRGWTYDGLAKRMTNLGCPIQASALYKIEKGEPRRRINVVEHVAFARVFESSLDDLLLPPEVVMDQRLKTLVREWKTAFINWQASEARVKTVLAEILRISRRDPVRVNTVLYDLLSVTSANDPQIREVLDRKIHQVEAELLAREAAAPGTIAETHDELVRNLTGGE